MTPAEFVRLVKRTLVPQGGVAERTIKSGIWVSALNVVDRVLHLAKLIVLARILSPADFGLMGLTLLTLAALRQFSKLGIDTALIQRAETDVDEYLNTAWSMKIARGVVIASVAFVMAPYAARFFGDPRVTDLVRVTALSPLILGFQNPGVMYLQKNLEFHRNFAYTLSGTVASVGVAIAAAITFQNVWALVFGTLAGSVVTLCASYVVHGYRPRPEFAPSLASELFEYGKWIFGSGIVLFLITQGDDALVGWLLGAGALGLYQLAYRLSNAPTTEVSHVITSVVFPAYSQLQTDVEQLRTGYFRTVQLTTLLSFPMAAGIVVVAPTFVRVGLGEQWLPMVLTMQILALWGAVRAVGATIGPLFQAVGRPDVNTKLQVVKLLIIAVFIYPATARWGIEGAALVVVGNALLVNPVADVIAVRQVDGRVKTFARLLAFPTVASVVMALCVLFVRTRLGGTPDVTTVALLVLTGVATYVPAIWLLERQFDYGLRGLADIVADALS